MPALKKLLTFVKRDDLEGRGIVSKDVIDRMFGLPALILNLVKAYPGHPDYVIDIVKRLFQAHYFEQYTRTVLMPMEFEELKKTGKATVKKMCAGSEDLNVVMIETDSVTMAGFLRAVEDVRADIVVVRRSTGHINVITKDRKPRVDFRATIRRIREDEALKKGIELEATEQELEKTGRLDAVKEWYYDTAANTLQNGGAAASDSVPPTSLQLDDVEKILLETLPDSLPKSTRTGPIVGRYR
jgi:PHD/YefM family antitoxin component YafN of YafNO toxin-antitoxin module